MISLLDLACMIHARVNLVLLLSLACVFQGMVVLFSLAFPFLDNHGMMGFSCFGLSRLPSGLKNE